MKPITFTCEEILGISPAEISSEILDLAKWPEFNGYGPLPGIKNAEFEVRTQEIVGTRIRITNKDGSTHVEEISEWQPDRKVTLHMKDFSAPLARFAAVFEETWNFQTVGNSTKVSRSFKLHAKSALARPILWLLSFILKKAIQRHLRQMRDGTAVKKMP